MRVLVSGASIAGPVLAYWLTRRGFDVTVVERAPALRLNNKGIRLYDSMQVPNYPIPVG
jgi:2-polyprenyl-6-methoxyphenol hydroxylase-like FAD-dependent oxidoreductase